MSFFHTVESFILFILFFENYWQCLMLTTLLMGTLFMEAIEYTSFYLCTAKKII